MNIQSSLVVYRFTPRQRVVPTAVSQVHLCIYGLHTVNMLLIITWIDKWFLCHQHSPRQQPINHHKSIIYESGYVNAHLEGVCTGLSLHFFNTDRLFFFFFFIVHQIIIFKNYIAQIATWPWADYMYLVTSLPSCTSLSKLMLPESDISCRNLSYFQHKCIRTSRTTKQPSV